jgi:hypothetical protein
MSDVITEAMIERTLKDRRVTSDPTFREFLSEHPSFARRFSRACLESSGLAAEVERLTFNLSSMSFALTLAEESIAELERAASGLAEALELTEDALRAGSYGRALEYVRAALTARTAGLADPSTSAREERVAELERMRRDAKARHAAELISRDDRRREYPPNRDIATMHGDRAQMCQEFVNAIDARIAELSATPSIKGE